jgi:hypothetical protein
MANGQGPFDFDVHWWHYVILFVAAAAGYWAMWLMGW